MKWLRAFLKRLRGVAETGVEVACAIEDGTPMTDPLSDEFRKLDKAARARATAAQDDADRAAILNASRRRPTDQTFRGFSKDDVQRLGAALNRRSEFPDAFEDAR